MLTLSRISCLAIWISALSASYAPAAVAASTEITDQPTPGAIGYLTPQDLPDMTRVLGPPPADGSGTKAGDVATYKSTRRLEGTPRWQLAVHDAQLGVSSLMEDFSCAMGKSLTRQDSPVMFSMLSRVLIDAATIERVVKNTWKRPRPFIEQGGKICVPVEPWLEKSFSYPSGHSTLSWTVALILSEIAPDKAADILSRARSYGESRVVCGVHYESDVQAGRVVGSVLYDQLQNNQTFRQDLEQSREELQAFRRSSSANPDPQTCLVQTQASMSPVW